MEVIRKSEGGCPVLVRLQSSDPVPENGGAARLVRDGGGVTALASWNGTLKWGRERGGEASQQFLIARDRTTGKVRLVEITTALLKPLISGEPQIETKSKAFELAETFGSKRTKRNADQHEKLKIDVETMEDQLKTAAAAMDVSVVKQADVTDSDSSIKYTPPANREATDVRQVYELKNILDGPEIEALKSSAEALLRGDPETVPVSDFMKKYIAKLGKSTDDSKIEYCVSLLYADCILYYLTADYKKARTVDFVVCPYSEVINNKVLNDFSVRTGKSRTRPQSLKDKATCYIIVLLLIASDQIVANYEELRKALSVPAPKLIQLIKVVGARMSTSDGESSIVLKLPLVKLPSLRIKREKK